MPILLALTAFLVLFISTVSSQDLQGKWDYFDPSTGKFTYSIQFIEKNQTWSAQIISLDPLANLKVCSNCRGELKNKALLGMDIAWGLQWEKDRLVSGSILDPESGKIYNCTISISGSDLLLVRGYYKLQAFGKTIHWRRRK